MKPQRRENFIYSEPSCEVLRGIGDIQQCRRLFSSVVGLGAMQARVVLMADAGDVIDILNERIRPRGKRNSALSIRR